MNDETPRGTSSEGSNTVRAGGAVTSILPPIGHTVEEELDAVLWALVGGNIELHDCTPAIQGLWAVAHADGRKSVDLDSRISRLSWLADYWFWRYEHPGKSFYAARTNLLWAEAAA